MLILGLLLVAAAVATALGAVFLIDGAQIEYAGIDISPLTLYVGGALTVVALVLGISLMRSATRRSLQARRDRKQLAKANAKLAKVEAERRAAAPQSGTAATSGTGTAPAADPATGPTTGQATGPTTTGPTTGQAPPPANGAGRPA
jgi:hypothetical protein